MMQQIAKLILSAGIGVLLLSSCNNQETTQPSRKDIIDAVFASGYIITDHEYKVTANTEGFLIEALADEGDTVKVGQRLFVISNEVQSEQLDNSRVNYNHALAKLNVNSPQLAQARLKAEQAGIQLASDEKNYERYTELIKSGAVSEADYDQVETQYESARRNFEIAEKSLADLRAELELKLKNAATQLAVEGENNNDYVLTSAIDGRVLSVMEKIGELIRRGETVAIIGGGETLVKLYIAEEDIKLIELGQRAVVSLNTDKSTTFEVRISKIYPTFDEQEQSFIVEAKFFKTPEKLFANTQLQANIIVADKEDILTLPTTYLLKGDSVILEDGSRKSVTVGIRNQEWVEIIGGITERQTLVHPKKPSS
jgi:multidrug efflux pump subunit AcrA (membrane-fusion protein)